MLEMYSKNELLFGMKALPMASISSVAERIEQQREQKRESKKAEELEWRKAVAEKMSERALTQKELAETLGYQRTWLSAVINGSEFSQAAKDRINRFLGIGEQYESNE